MQTLYRHINDCLTKIHLLRRRTLLQSLGERKLHPSQMAILDYISNHPNCTQAEIAENMTLTPAAITLATQRLQKESLIEKQVDQNNLRRNMLHVTDLGKHYLEESAALFQRVDASMFQGLSQEDLLQLKGYLDRVSMNMTGEDTNEVNFQVINALAEQVCKAAHDTRK